MWGTVVPVGETRVPVVIEKGAGSRWVRKLVCFEVVVNRSDLRGDLLVSGAIY